MNQESIQRIKESHPQVFALKRAAGLDENQAAQVIQAQIEADQANPPGPAALRHVRNLAEILASRLRLIKELFTETQEALTAAVNLNPDLPASEFPSLPSLGSDGSAELEPLRAALAAREQEVINLGAEITLKNERIQQLEAERDEATAAAAKLQEQLDTALSQAPEATTKAKKK